MEPQNYLGIYLSKNRATVVCLGPRGRDRNLLGCFSVFVEGQEEQNQQVLASLIAQGCAERRLEFSEVAVALDCAMFMQHRVHSEFNDPKQIAATVRFDTEEALATDITGVAIAFQITSSDQNGSELTVFTAQRNVLSDVLISLQGHNIDPVTVEPDVNCLSRFICQNVQLPESRQGRNLFGMLSRDRGYFISYAKPRGISTVRTFLVGPTQDREELLAREALVTTALTETSEPINHLEVFDSTGSVNHHQLGEKLGIEVGGVDWLGSAGIEPRALADCADPVDFAIAYGAALAHLDKTQSINFRNDFMPYQGRKLRLQKALKFASISVTVLLLAIGLYFQTQLLKINKNRSRLRDKFEPSYLAVMLDEKKLPTKFKEAVRKLGSVLRRIEDERKGLITDQEAISAKLALVLEAINECAAKTNLNINSISITARNISIVGDTDTSGNRNTLKFFAALRKSGLEISREGVYAKGGRDHFTVTIEPKK